MENVNEIIDKIIVDAITKCADVLKDANDVVRAKVAKAKETVAKNLEEEKVAVKKEIDAQIATKTALAKKDVENILLDKKKALTDDAFSLAHKKLCVLDKANYLKIVEKSIMAKAQQGDEIVLSCDGVLTAMDLLSLSIVKSLNLQVASSLGDFIGGVKLKQCGAIKDLTFFAVIEDAKNTLSNKVQIELFGE